MKNIDKTNFKANGICSIAVEISHPTSEILDYISEDGHKLQSFSINESEGRAEIMTTFSAPIREVAADLIVNEPERVKSLFITTKINYFNVEGSSSERGRLSIITVLHENEDEPAKMASETFDHYFKDGSLPHPTVVIHGCQSRAIEKWKTNWFQ